MTVRFHPEAQRELLGAITFYEQKAQALGADLLDEVEQTLQLLKTFPKLGTPITESDRRMLVGRFPFAIVYSQDEDIISIKVFMHLSRRPGYWKTRA